jgi:large subunit ribosomal protein L24
MKEFSIKWRGSKKPGKQRKFRINAPLHVKGKFVRAHLSKELRKQHNKRSLRIRNGDTVKIMRGKFKNKTGKVEGVNLKEGSIFVSDMVVSKKDGTKSFIGIDPSNLMLIEIKTDDKERRKTLEKKAVEQK